MSDPKPTPTPCPRGHTERRATNNECLVCSRERVKTTQRRRREVYRWYLEQVERGLIDQATQERIRKAGQR